MEPSFLDRLGDDARSWLLTAARPVSFAKGATLVRQGEPARGAFVLRQGAVEAIVTLPGGENLRVARLGAGQVIGEMALIETGTCTATVLASEDVEGWFVAHDDFRALVSQRHSAALALQHAVTMILAEKLGALNARVAATPAREDATVEDAVPGDPLAGLARSGKPPFDAAGFLPKLPVFERFDPDEIAELASRGAYLEVPRGAALFSAGSPSTAAFVVVRGAVEIAVRHERRRRRMAVLGPGQLFGHLGVLRESAHSSDATARENAVLLELPAPVFRETYFGASGTSMSLRHAVQRSLLASIARTNRMLTRLIAQQALEAAPRGELERAYRAQLATV